MKTAKAVIFYFMPLIVVVFTMSIEGLGQTKFFTTDNPIPNKYIVVLDKATFNDESKLLVEPTAQNLATAYGGELGFIYESAIKCFSIEMIEADAIALSQDSQVEYVTEDNEMYMSDTQLNAPWNLDRLDQRDRPLNSTYTYNANGAGVSAYIIDSGINRFHVEYNGRATIGADFVGGNGIDCNGHGTHVAGTVGGTTYGVAKGVFIVAVRVFGCSGSSSSSTIIAGINWVAANHASKSVANLSLGGGANHATDDAVRNLIARGVTCVVAAGNNNADTNNTSPARVRQAITVGAVDINDNRAGFSNVGTAVDIFAPGVSITSAWFDGGYNVLSGTSIAAPHVTGVVAQYLQLTPSFPGFPIPTPLKIQDVIVANASWSKVSNRGTGSPNTLLYNANFPYGETLVPFYRYLALGGTDHFYTSTWSEMGAGNYGYTIEGVAGYVLSTQSSGTIPLYRYYSVGNTDHYYTNNFSELGNGANGYVYEGIAGYMYTNPAAGRSPLHVYYSSVVGDHFYTTNFSELGNGANGYVYEGIAGYILQQ